MVATGENNVTLMVKVINAVLAQKVEQGFCKPQVPSSILGGGTR